jgi:hypothetical protein
VNGEVVAAGLRTAFVPNQPKPRLAHRSGYSRMSIRSIPFGVNYVTCRRLLGHHSFNFAVLSPAL